MVRGSNNFPCYLYDWEGTGVGYAPWSDNHWNAWDESIDCYAGHPDDRVGFHGDVNEGQ